MKPGVLALFCAYAVLLLPTEIFAGHKTGQDFCLEISGRVETKRDKGNSTYTVELFFRNQVIERKEVRSNHTFRFLLSKNQWYAIRISRQGYSPCLISICTNIPKSREARYKFHFDTGLIPMSEARSMDKDALDFPIAIVSYNKDEECFYYSEEYTSNIKEWLRKPLLARNNRKR